MKTKVCPKCGIEKPLTREYFHFHSRQKSGFRSRCIECTSEDKKAYLQRIRGDSYKRRKSKPQRDPKKYYQENKKRISEYAKKYYALNKEKLIERQKKYYYLHKDEINSKNPSVYRKKNRKRKALIDKTIATLSERQWLDCLEYFDYKCAYCGKTGKLEQEHFVPLSEGGEYTVKNIIPACKSCNCSKRNKDFFVWYSTKPFYNDIREKKILKYLEIKDKQQQIALF